MGIDNVPLSFKLGARARLRGQNFFEGSYQHIKISPGTHLNNAN